MGIYTVVGIVWGFLNVASMQMILTIWDPTKSRPVVQITMLCFSLGALTTSTTLKIFYGQQEASINCGGGEDQPLCGFRNILSRSSTNFENRLEVKIEYSFFFKKVA